MVVSGLSGLNFRKGVRDLITLSNGVSFETRFYGFSSILGVLYIDIPGMTMQQALNAFSDAEALKEIQYQNGDYTETRKGFVKLVGVEYPNDNVDASVKFVRITLRRLYEGEES